jgi:hypothetical protein
MLTDSCRAFRHELWENAAMLGDATNKPEPQRVEPHQAEPGKADLLADLETRQDEVLRLLADLEARTLAALSTLGGTAGSNETKSDTVPDEQPRAVAAVSNAAGDAPKRASRRRAA